MADFHPAPPASKFRYLDPGLRFSFIVAVTSTVDALNHRIGYNGPWVFFSMSLAVLVVTLAAATIYWRRLRSHSYHLENGQLTHHHGLRSATLLLNEVRQAVFSDSTIQLTTPAHQSLSIDRRAFPDLATAVTNLLPPDAAKNQSQYTIRERILGSVTIVSAVVLSALLRQS